RVARAAEAVPRPRSPRRARLRDSRGREVRRRPGAGPPHRAAARALGAAAPAGRHRRRASRPRADAQGRARARGRVTRTATPKLGAYTALAGVGLLGALVAGRPELAAHAAPFAAVLVLGLSLARAPRVSAILHLDRQRQLPGQPLEVERQ